MKAGAIGLTLLLAAAMPLAAQDSDAAGCPVSMHAQQKGGGTNVLVTADGQRRLVPSGIHLTLKSSQMIHMSVTGDHDLAQIASARVIVRGTNGKPHAMDAGTTPDGRWDASKTLNLTFRTEDEGVVGADLPLSGFTSVTSIRLVSLTFSDGSVWTAPGATPCRTSPDPFMLVSARQIQ
jgi:hypothetical protein